MKVCLSLMKTLLRPLAKFVLIPLGLTAAASATDAGIHKNFLGSGNVSINNFKNRNGIYHENNYIY